MSVAAKSCEQCIWSVDFPMNGSQGIEQMKTFNGTAGSMRVSTFVSEDERRQSSTVDDAGGKNSKDAAMPCWVVQNQALSQKVPSLTI